MAAEESTAAPTRTARRLAPKEALASTAVEALLEAEATEARSLHMRRELHQALEHGFALLDALNLPPLALDVIDDAIATLDALEAPEEDREPWLAGVHCSLADPTGTLDGDALDDGEHDTADAEPSIGWPNDFRAVLANVEGSDLDVEEVNEDGAGGYDLAWWERSSHPPMGVGAHV